MFFSGCSTDGTTGGDSINISSVSPNSGLVDGFSYDFTVVVEYELATVEQGEIGVGFNNGSTVSGYVLIRTADQIVDKGSDQYTFNVTAEAKDWGASEDFCVYVHISEYPHTSPWAPLDSDRMTLTF
jgi:hypothetical protein